MEMAEMQNGKNWPYVLTFLPEELEKTARDYEVFTRKRQISSAEDLLRMMLAYSVSDLSLQSTCAWAEALGIASMSKPAFFYRVKDATGWLINLLSYVLNIQSCLEKNESEKMKIRIVDATHIQGPGAISSEWRIHAKINVDSSGKHWSMEGLQITDESVGESYGLHSLEPGDIVIGDRAYGIATSIFYAKEFGADVIARIYPYNIRICNLAKEVIRISEYQNEVPEIGLFSMNIAIPIPPEKRTKSKKKWKLENARDWIFARLIGCRNRDGEVIWVITTLTETFMSDFTVMNLYRIRWQIELLFKRLKSIAWLDKLPSPHKGPTALSWIAGRLLGAALAEAMNDQSSRSFSPWGYRLRRSDSSPT